MNLNEDLGQVCMYFYIFSMYGSFPHPSVFLWRRSREGGMYVLVEMPGSPSVVVERVFF